MTHGPEILPGGSVRFRLWAPAYDRVDVVLRGEPAPIPMTATGGGWHELITARARPGSRYKFRLPNGLEVPDPASRYQPDDVHGPSEVVDLHDSVSDPRPAQRRDRKRAQPGASDWRGRPWRETVLYELHVGTYTPEGTFQALIGKLDYLSSLGITAIEIMPVADFPGRRNWGYDGVLPYAPDSSYGRPEDFRALVEAAHARGLMMILDVVYNHFGPDGNYLSAYAPAFFTGRHKTPWGPAINFECRPVRDFVVENALYWLRDYQLDGLRLDAVHAIVDDSPKHILQEIAERVRAEIPDRHIHLILENEKNQSRWLGQGLYTAQWNDDVHHVLHTAVTGESKGYYATFQGDTQKLGRAFAEGFVRGDASAHLHPDSFIAFLQNHDQIGNRAFGERIGALAPPAAVRAAAAAYLLLPQIPMLFMGEEWNASSPFPFVCDFGPELAGKVRDGRREEFSHFPEFQDPVQRERIPDPQSPATFASAKLNWEEASGEWLEWYRRILACRRDRILPLLDGLSRGTFEILAPGAVVVRWGALTLAANLSPSPCDALPAPAGEIIWQEGRPGDGWSVSVTQDSSPARVIPEDPRHTNVP